MERLYQRQELPKKANPQRVRWVQEVLQKRFDEEMALPRGNSDPRRRRRRRAKLIVMLKDCAEFLALPDPYPQHQTKGEWSEWWDLTLDRNLW